MHAAVRSHCYFADVACCCRGVQAMCRLAFVINNGTSVIPSMSRVRVGSGRCCAVRMFPAHVSSPAHVYFSCLLRLRRESSCCRVCCRAGLKESPLLKPLAACVDDFLSTFLLAVKHKVTSRSEPVVASHVWRLREQQILENE